MARTEDVLAVPKLRKPAAPAARTYEQGVADGASNERLRIAAILNSDAAQIRVQTAQRLALTTNMTPEQAAAVLESVQPDVNPYIAAMQAEAIGIGPGAGVIEPGTRAAREAEIKQNMRAFNDARAGRRLPREL